jgi:N-acetylglutamate synthase-like GNAT family acetyltransferase
VAGSTDLPAIEELLTAANLPTVGVGALLATFVVAEHGGAIIGVAGLELCRTNALLRSVAVAPEWQGKGVGRALVSRVIADAEVRRVHALYLLTTTAEHYFPALGFTVTSRETTPGAVRATAEFRSACPASATVMTRPVMPTNG